MAIQQFCFDSIIGVKTEHLNKLFYTEYTKSNGETNYAAYIIGSNLLCFFNKDGILTQADSLIPELKTDGIYIVNKDSFYVFTSDHYDFNLYLFINNKIKRHWKPDSKENTATFLRTYFIFNPFHDFKIFEKSNRLYCVVNAPLIDLNNGLPAKDISSGTPQLSIIALRDSIMKIDFSFASFDNITAYHMDYVTTFTYINDSIIAYTSEAQPDIYFYNILSRKFIKKWNPGFEYFRKNSIYNTDSISSPDYTNRYRCSNTRKYFLKYNPANKTLYCMYTLPQSMDTDTVPIAGQGDFILATLDPYNYKLKQEYRFNGKQYFNVGAIFFEDKIGVARNVNPNYKRCYDIFSF